MGLGRTDKLTYDITLLDNRPVKSHPYQLAPPKMEAMWQITDQLVKEGVIKPSVSPYASPAFLVCRPNKKPRLVIDYRKLNKNIEIEAQPLPNIHTCFQWFSGV